MGSGTTGEAAHIEGRHFIGMERELEYFHEIAVPRIRAAGDQMQLTPAALAPPSTQQALELQPALKTK